MKIIHVITTINRGGAENHLRDLIRGQIDNQELDVSCAYLKGDGYWMDLLQEMGCNVFPLGMNRYGSISPAMRLRQTIKQLKPDIVHAHLAPAELYSRIALLGDSKTSLVITRHNHNRFYRGFASDMLEGWVVSRAQAMIGISGSVHRFFTRKFPALSSRFHVVPYGIEPSALEQVSHAQREALRLEWGVAPDTVLIGTVARLVPIKNLKSLIDGYAQLLKLRLPTPTKLVLVGSGPLEAELKSQAKDLGLGESVIFAGFRQDIPVVMNVLDIFVLTSLSEGFGLVLLEAMSASKTVISTNVSALPEIVVEGETGLMVPTNDPVSLCKAMRRLVEDAGFRERLGVAGHARVVSDFSLDAMWSRTMSIYQRVLESKR